MRHLHRTALMAACLTTALALGACNQPPASPAPPTAAVAAQTPVERGRVLVTAGGCHDCHTPKTFGPKGPQLDTDRLLSGHPEGGKIPEPYTPASGSPWTIATTDSLTAWSGPWGVSFAVNLTPDPNTGLRSGVWTEELFIKAMRTGKHMGRARDILPPMPWQMYGQLSDEDLKAIWAYLGTVPPISNHVPEPIAPTRGIPK